MESANLHHLQTPQLIASSTSSPSSSTPPYATSATWTQNFTLNNHGNQKHEISNPHFSDPVIQDLGLNHWNTNQLFEAHHHDQQIGGKIKQELLLSPSESCFPKFAELLTSSSISEEDSSLSCIKDEQKYMNDILREKLLLKTISSGFPINNGAINNQYLASHNYSYGRGNHSQIYPSINISNLNGPPPSISPASFDMNLEALDLLTSTRFGGSFEQQPFLDNLCLYKHSNVMQHSAHIPSCNPSKIPSSSSSVFTTNEMGEAKRPIIEPKATQPAPKKPRLDSRASSPPFKVRKEKLGDRIAALQQLVAPFGKTDTASVLMEAIGYIKFLQNQVETLSVPYMKSSRYKSSRTTQTFQGSATEEGNDGRKKDLRSRGLCLVPLSCMSYVTGDGGSSGGGIWPPPNFGGGT